MEEKKTKTQTLPGITFTGNITVNIAGDNTYLNYTIIVPINDHENVITLPVLGLGTYTVTAQYMGDNNYNKSKVASKSFTVTKWNATDLQDLIDKAIANNESEVNLTHDYEFGDDQRIPVVINSSLKVNGNGHTIDANGTKGVFNITGDDVELDDMNITNVEGTAITSTGNNTTISDVNLTNIDGTGIEVKGDNAKLEDVTITNSTGIGIDIYDADNANLTNIDITGHNGTAIRVAGNNSEIGPVNIFDSKGTGINVTGENNKANTYNRVLEKYFGTNEGKE